MKQNIILFITLIFSSSAFAAAGNFGADIYSMDIHPTHAQSKNIQSATIQVDADQEQGSITLFLQPKANICQSEFCPAVMPMPLAIKLPMVGIEQDSCGSIHYTAAFERLGPGIAPTQILVSDNSLNRCPTFMELAPTDIVYSSANSEFEIQSNFLAKKLKAEVNILPVEANLF